MCCFPFANHCLFSGFGRVSAGTCSGWWLTVCSLTLGCCFTWAHPTDVSYLRVKVEREHLEMRFTFNLAMLSRFAVLDRDGDQQLAASELTAAQPEVLRYLQEKVRVKINDLTATLGSEMVLEPLWPEAKTGKLVPTRDFPMRHVDLIFRPKVPPPLASLGLDFSIWTETGPLGTVEATYEQGDLIMQVPFSATEPDYLYDTGFAVESVFTEVASDSSSWAFVGWVLGVVVGLIALGFWLKKQR